MSPSRTADDLSPETGAHVAIALEDGETAEKRIERMMLMAMAIWPGGLVAICDLGDDEGDLAPIATEADAEQECSAGSVARVV